MSKRIIAWGYKNAFWGQGDSFQTHFLLLPPLFSSKYNRALLAVPRLHNSLPAFVAGEAFTLFHILIWGVLLRCGCSLLGFESLRPTALMGKVKLLSEWWNHSLLSDIPLVSTRPKWLLMWSHPRHHIHMQRRVKMRLWDFIKSDIAPPSPYIYMNKEKKCLTLSDIGIHLVCTLITSFRRYTTDGVSEGGFWVTGN